MLILLLVFRNGETPLHASILNGKREICRLLVALKADVAARDRCRSPWRARYDLLTRVAETAKLHSNAPSTGTRPTLLHICAVSSRRNDALTAPHPPGNRLARSKPCNRCLDTVTFCRRSEQIGVDATGMLEQQLLVSSTLCNSSFMQNKDLISMLDG